MLDVDNLGLDLMDRKLLSAMLEKFGGGPVGLDNIAAAIGESTDTIEDVIEPHLIQQGYLQRTARAHGDAVDLAALGLVPPRIGGDLPVGDGADRALAAGGDADAVRAGGMFLLARAPEFFMPAQWGPSIGAASIRSPAPARRLAAGAPPRERAIFTRCTTRCRAACPAWQRSAATSPCCSPFWC